MAVPAVFLADRLASAPIIRWLEHLKNINKKRLGCFAGSRALCKLANVIGTSCRATDTALHFAENEFVVILPETSAAGVTKLVRRISERLNCEIEGSVLRECRSRRVSARGGKIGAARDGGKARLAEITYWNGRANTRL